MEKQEIFILCLLLVIVAIYLPSACETYLSGSFNITPSITTDMDWKGSQLSAIPAYPNNLVDASGSVLNQIKQLQTYQASQDGQTTSNYVASGMKEESGIDNPNSLEGFQMMNPFVPM